MIVQHTCSNDTSKEEDLIITNTHFVLTDLANNNKKMSFNRKKMNTSKFSNMKSFSLVVSIVIIIILQLSCVSSFDEKRHRAECQMWGKLENRTLPLQNQGHADCAVNDECTGFMCKGQYQVI